MNVPPSPQCSVPARYARLHYALGGGGKETKTTTNILPKVPNSFQDLTRSKYNSPRAPVSGWSGGTLDILWTCPGTIEPPETPIFDQPGLSNSLCCGISATERFRCGAELWSAGIRRLRLCGTCSGKLDLWAAFS